MRERGPCEFLKITFLLPIIHTSHTRYMFVYIIITNRNVSIIAQLECSIAYSRSSKQYRHEIGNRMTQAGQEMEVQTDQSNKLGHDFFEGLTSSIAIESDSTLKLC